MRLLGVRQIVALTACLIFAFTPTVWGQSTIAEVYTLQTLFVIAAIYLFLQWNQKKQNRYFYQATALYALSFTHHLTAITLLPGIFLITIATDRKVFGDLRKIIWIVGITLLSAMSYVYLFWRSRDPQLLYFEYLIYSRADFWDYVTGGDFRSFMFGFTIWELLSVRVLLVTKILFTEFPLLASMVVGAFILHLGNRVVSLFLLLIFLGNALFVLNYDVIDSHVFLMPNYLIAAIYVSLFLTAIHEYVSTRFEKSTWLPSVALLLVPFVLFCLGYPGMAHRNRDNKMAARQILLNLEAVEHHAILLTLDDDYMINMDYLYFLHGEDWAVSLLGVVDVWYR
jgi:4-amino-4-deoxy-L-arabinose transferase-like glycosyltransferase